MPNQSQAGSSPTDMFRVWNDMQQRLWNNWAAMANPKMQRSADEAVKDSLSTFEDSVAEMIEGQAEWQRQCLKAMHRNKDALPPVWQAPYEQMEQFVDYWAAMQQSMAKVWINALSHHQPAGWSGGVELTRGVIEGWNDMQQRWNSENVWMKMLHGAASQGSRQAAEQETASHGATIEGEAGEQPKRGRRHAA